MEAVRIKYKCHKWSKLSELVKIVAIGQNCHNWSKLSQFIKIVTVVTHITEFFAHVLKIWKASQQQQPQDAKGSPRSAIKNLVDKKKKLEQPGRGFES